MAKPDLPWLPDGRWVSKYNPVTRLYEHEYEYRLVETWTAPKKDERA